MAVARPAELRAGRGVVMALPAPEAETAAAEPRSRAREKFASRPAGPLRKRPPPPPLAGRPSSSRPPSAPPRKKARDVPGISFSVCQGCRVDVGSTDALEVLESNWRALLLCPGCIHAVRTLNACAYCFERFPGEYPRRRVVDCVDCGCRVHLVCIPAQRGYITPYDLDPSLFCCVDCSAIPLYFQPPRDAYPKPDCSAAVVKGMSTDLVRDANLCLKRKTITVELAKQKAMDKAEAAKLAADHARDVFDFALVACQNSPSSSAEPMCPKVPDDEELAFRLHLAMNGSQRISRTQPSLKHQKPSLISKRTVPNGYLTDKKLVPNGSNFHEVKVCVDDSSYEDIDGLVAGSLGVIPNTEPPSYSSSPLSNSSSGNRYASVGNDKIHDPVMQKQTGSLGKDLNPALSGDGMDSECLSASSTRSNGNNDAQDLVQGCAEGLVEESSAVVQVNVTLTTPDRYLKKYTRNNRLRKTPDSKGITEPPAPVLGTCSSCSNASRDFSSATFGAPVFAVDASANVGGSSGCQ